MEQNYRGEKWEEWILFEKFQSGLIINMCNMYVSTMHGRTGRNLNKESRVVITLQLCSIYLARNSHHH